MSKITSASANAGNIMQPTVAKCIPEVLDEQARRPRHFLRQTPQQNSPIQAQPQPLRPQARIESPRNLGIVVEKMPTSTELLEMNYCEPYPLLSPSESKGTLEQSIHHSPCNDDQFIVQNKLQVMAQVDQRSHSQNKVRDRSHSRQKQNSQIKVRIVGSDIQSSNQHSQDNLQTATANDGVEDTINIDERKENNVTPSTVYKGSHEGKYTNMINFKPRLGPINAGAEVVPTASISKEGEVSPNKNYQSMMVNMLKQQVKRRRRQQKSQVPQHQIQYNMAGLMTDIRESQRSSFAITTGQQRSGSTTPLEGSIYRMEQQQSQIATDKEEDNFPQQIVFNMLTPKLSHHQHILVTSNKKVQAPLPLINLNPTAPSRAPKTTKHNQSLDFAKIRMGLNPLSSRNNWRQLTDQASRQSYEIIPENESPSARQSKQALEKSTKVTVERFIAPTKRKLHELLRQPASIQEQKNLTTNPATVSMNNLPITRLKSQGNVPQRHYGKKKMPTRGHQSSQHQAVCDPFMNLHSQAFKVNKHAALPAIQSFTDLKSQDSMNVGSYTLVPNYSKGRPVEYTITNGSSSDYDYSDQSLRIQVPSVNQIQPLVVVPSTDILIEPDKHVSNSKKGTGETRKFIDVPHLQPGQTPTDENLTMNNFVLKSDEQTLEDMSQQIIRERASRLAGKISPTITTTTGQRPSDNLNESVMQISQMQLSPQLLQNVDISTPGANPMPTEGQTRDDTAADQSKSMGRMPGVRDDHAVLSLANDDISTNRTKSGLLNEEHQSNRAIITLQQQKVRSGNSKSNLKRGVVLPTPIIDEQPSFFDQASYDQLSNTLKDSHDKSINSGIMVMRGKRDHDHDDQSNMVAFEPPEPANFEQDFRPDDFALLSPYDKQAAMAGKFGHFVLQKRIRELALGRTDNQLRQYLIQLPQQLQHELYGIRSCSQSSMMDQLQQYGTPKLFKDDIMDANMIDSQQQVNFIEDSLTSATPTFFMNNQVIAADRGRLSNKKKKKKLNNIQKYDTRPIIVTGSSLFNNGPRTQDSGTGDDFICSSLMQTHSLNFDKANRLSSTHYPNQNQPMMQTYVKAPKTAANMSHKDARSAVSSTTNVDKMEESKMFALNSDLVQVDVFKRPEMQRWKKPQRMTFSNLDRFFPHYYQVPQKPSTFDSFEHRNLKQAKQHQQQSPKDFQQKSPILQLLEVNGRLPKTTRNLVYEQQRSASVPCRNALPDPSTTLYGYNSIRTQRQYQQLQQNQYETSNPRNRDLYDTTPNQNQAHQNQQTTRIYLQKMNSRSTLKKLINMQEKLQRWSSDHSVHSENITSEHMNGSVSPKSTANLNDFLRSTQRKSNPSQFDNKPKSPAIQKPSVTRVVPTAPVSPKSSTRDVKNATARHSDFFSEEDYETQYLSQVSRHGFFGAKSSTRNNDAHRRSTQEDDQLFDREAVGDDNSFSNNNGDEKFEQKKKKPQQAGMQVKQSKQNLHKRLQDIAYRIKNHRKGAAAAGLIQDVMIKKTQRAGSQNAVLRSANDSVTKIMPLSQQNIGHNKKLQLQLLRQGNNCKNVPTVAQAVKKPMPSPVGNQRSSHKSKEFRCIQIQHWDAVGIPETAQVVSVSTPPILLPQTATATAASPIIINPKL